MGRSAANSVMRVRNLQIAYHHQGQERQVLSDISFTLHACEIVSLLGESGSGKSTIAKALCGLLPSAARKTGGTIWLGSRDTPVESEADWRAVRGRQIGMLFQDARLALNPLMKIGRHFQESLMAHRLATADQALEIGAGLLAKLGFDHPRDALAKYPFELSGGMCQRVCLALAICLQPKLLIADEPTSALDVSNQRDVLELLKRLQRELGLTVLFITHDLSVAKAVSSRVIVLNEGELVEQGEAGAVLTAPRNAYTRRLVEARAQLHTSAQVNHNRTEAGEDAPLLAVAGLSKSYGRAVLRGVDLTLQHGEILGVLGKSGCGKSTLARCLAGLEQADAGRILWKGQPWAELRGKVRRERAGQLQMIFQDARASLHAGRTALQLVQEPLHYMKIGSKRSREEIASRLLDEVGIVGELQRLRPPQLSTGQCQRIAIARALAPSPRVLVCDEAISALDMSIQAQILALLQRIHQKYQLAIVMISHDVRVLQTFCHRIAVMQDGRFCEVRPAGCLHESKIHHTQQLLRTVDELEMAFSQYG